MSAHYDIRDASPALEVLWAKPGVTEIRLAHTQPLLGICRDGRITWYPGATVAEAAHRACIALSPRTVTHDLEELP